MTETAPVPTKLSRAELPVAILLTQGLSLTGIATRLHLSPRTVHCHLRRIRRKMDLPGIRRTPLVNVLLERRLVPTPIPGRAAPALPADDLALLEAIAHEPSLDAIAVRMGISRRKVSARIDYLIEVAGAISTEHLVTLARGWQLLGTGQNLTVADTDRTAPPVSPSPDTADWATTPDAA
ncbi:MULTISPECIES: response regulator transcription factor [unclassified Streptomyces]|uniref:response regulator transcription factor n=1 Tax=unclassified Streptomyces TaxID=2593676 RepID=UPI001C2E22BA|nr:MULTISPECIES: helix-turn-helix transcriptional regulator [unclassified Streptomyces]MBV1949119.1 helix-turn-helix transcriptional regulator [Streptomyces sp. BV129]